MESLSSLKKKKGKDLTRGKKRKRSPAPAAGRISPYRKKRSERGKKRASSPERERSMGRLASISSRGNGDFLHFSEEEKRGGKRERVKGGRQPVPRGRRGRRRARRT